MASAAALKPEDLASLIHWIRGEKVLLDADLAALYGVEARALNQAVSRNRARFPADFMFQLSTEEYEHLRNSSQPVMSSTGTPLRSTSRSCGPSFNFAD